MVDKAEQFLLDAGFRQVRVRIHGTIARIEIGADEFGKMLADDFHLQVNQKLKEIGFSYVTLDMGGYRTGSMNDSILEKRAELRLFFLHKYKNILDR